MPEDQQFAAESTSNEQDVFEPHQKIFKPESRNEFDTIHQEQNSNVELSFYKEQYKIIQSQYFEFLKKNSNLLNEANRKNADLEAKIQSKENELKFEQKIREKCDENNLEIKTKLLSSLQENEKVRQELADFENKYRRDVEGKERQIVSLQKNVETSNLEMDILEKKFAAAIDEMNYKLKDLREEKLNLESCINKMAQSSFSSSHKNNSIDESNKIFPNKVRVQNNQLNTSFKQNDNSQIVPSSNFDALSYNELLRKYNICLDQIAQQDKTIADLLLKLNDSKAKMASFSFKSSHSSFEATLDTSLNHNDPNMVYIKSELQNLIEKRAKEQSLFESVVQERNHYKKVVENYKNNLYSKTESFQENFDHTKNIPKISSDKSLENIENNIATLVKSLDCEKFEKEKEINALYALNSKLSSKCESVLDLNSVLESDLALKKSEAEVIKNYVSSLIVMLKSANESISSLNSKNEKLQSEKEFLKVKEKTFNFEKKMLDEKVFLIERERKFWKENYNTEKRLSAAAEHIQKTLPSFEVLKSWQESQKVYSQSLLDTQKELFKAEIQTLESKHSQLVLENNEISNLCQSLMSENKDLISKNEQLQSNLSKMTDELNILSLLNNQKPELDSENGQNMNLNPSETKEIQTNTNDISQMNLEAHEKMREKEGIYLNQINDLKTKIELLEKKNDSNQLEKEHLTKNLSDKTDQEQLFPKLCHLFNIDIDNGREKIFDLFIASRKKLERYDSMENELEDLKNNFRNAQTTQTNLLTNMTLLEEEKNQLLAAVNKPSNEAHDDIDEKGHEIQGDNCFDILQLIQNKLIILKKALNFGSEEGDTIFRENLEKIFEQLTNFQQKLSYYFDKNNKKEDEKESINYHNEEIASEKSEKMNKDSSLDEPEKMNEQSDDPASLDGYIKLSESSLETGEILSENSSDSKQGKVSESKNCIVDEGLLFSDEERNYDHNTCEKIPDSKIEERPESEELEPILWNNQNFDF